MLVDGHVHVWSADRARYPRRPKDEASTATIPGSAGMLFRTLDMHGVDVAVVVQPRIYGADHGYLLHCLEVYRNRMVAVAALDPRDGGAVAELPRLVAAGIGGLRLDAHGWGVDPISEGTVLPLWDAAAECSIPIELMIRPEQLPAVAPLAARAATVQVVIEHAARYGASADAPLDSLLELGTLPNVSIKVSALASISAEPPPHHDVWPMIERVLEIFGPERLMWGSDMPWIGAEAYGAELDAIRSLPFLDEVGRAWVLGRTATRVFGLA